MTFRKGINSDLEKLKELALKSWTQFKNELTDENWDKLFKIINNDNTYSELLKTSECLVCESNDKEIIGMAFLVSNGNPTEIYDDNWCYIRFVSVNPEYRGNAIGEQLTNMCIQIALKNNEKVMN